MWSFAPWTKYWTYTKGRESVHSFKACQNDTRSWVCKIEGHKPGAILCPQYVNDNSADVKAFDGDKCSFDFFPCELKVFGEDFNSTEQTLHLTTAMHSEDLNSHGVENTRGHICSGMQEDRTIHPYLWVIALGCSKGNGRNHRIRNKASGWNELYFPAFR